MRIQHDIFRVPNAVKPTLIDQPTPNQYFLYPGAHELPESMPMWRVQTEGYLTTNDVMIGLVSGDAGFLDSPDTEWISGGVTTKGPDAVALGRHGNFFHWGFAASPTYLTEEAKLVFINAIHYIAQFDGKGVVARKRPGTLLRSDLEWQIENMSEEVWSARAASVAAKQLSRAKEQAALRAREQAGETLNEFDRQLLSSGKIEGPGRFAAARPFYTEAQWAALDKKPEDISAYLRENGPYFRPTGWYQIEIDEDLKALGVGNNNPAFLERMIAIAKNTERSDLAMKLLHRYTNEEFTSAVKWEQWYSENQGRFFFSESAGYKWLVNKGDLGSLPKLSPTAKSPIDWEPSLRRTADSQLKLTVHVQVLEGWHAYAKVPSNQPYIPLTIDLDLPDGVSLLGEWISPPSQEDSGNPGLHLFTGSFAFEATLAVAATAKVKDGITCRLAYQVCDLSMCMPPKTDARTLPLK